MATKQRTEADWQAEGDAHSVAEAAAIQNDPSRLQAARVAAKRLAAEEKKRAEQAQARSKAMTNLASKPNPKPVANKPAAKPKPKAKGGKKRR